MTEKDAPKKVTALPRNGVRKTLTEISDDLDRQLQAAQQNEGSAKAVQDDAARVMNDAFNDLDVYLSGRLETIKTLMSFITEGYRGKTLNIAESSILAYVVSRLMNPLLPSQAHTEEEAELAAAARALLGAMIMRVLRSEPKEEDGTLEVLMFAIVYS